MTAVEPFLLMFSRFEDKGIGRCLDLLPTAYR